MALFTLLPLVDTAAHSFSSSGTWSLSHAKTTQWLMLFYYFRSHAHLYDEHGEYSAHAEDSIKYPPKPTKERKELGRFSKVINKVVHSSRIDIDKKEKAEEMKSAALTISTADLEAQTALDGSPVDSASSSSDDMENPQLTAWVAFGLLVVVTVVSNIFRVGLEYYSDDNLDS